MSKKRFISFMLTFLLIFSTVSNVTLSSNALIAPNSSIKVLLIGYDESGTSNSLTATDLKSLFTSIYANVEVDFHKASGRLFMDSYYMPKYKDATKLAVSAKKYDYIVMIDNSGNSYQYPQYHYAGVSAIAELARNNGSIPMLYIHGNLIDVSYRIAKGTRSIAIPGGIAVTKNSVTYEEKHFVSAASIFSQIINQKPDTSSISIPNITKTRLGLLAQSAFDTVTQERSKIHYSTPYDGRVKISNKPYPQSGSFPYVFCGTSTEKGWNGAMISLLPAAGYIAADNFIVKGGRTFLQSYVDWSISSKKPFLIAFAREWGVNSTAFTNFIPNIQCQTYSKVEPGNGFAFNALEASNNIDCWMTFGQYSNSAANNIDYIPLMEGVAIFYDKMPNVLFSSDQIHMTTPYLQFLASMTFTSRTGNNISNNTAITSVEVSAQNLGYNIIKTWANLSDNGEFIPENQEYVVLPTPTPKPLPTPIPGNLVGNASIESGTTSWSAFGGAIEANTSVFHGGVASLRAYNRTATWNGSIQKINLANGRTYNSKVWVKLGAGSDTVNVIAALTVNGSTVWRGLASGTANSTGWTELNGTYTFNEANTITEAKVYVETSSSLTDIYSDDYYIAEIPKPTATPTASPTATPTASPTATPTASPTATPTPITPSIKYVAIKSYSNGKYVCAEENGMKPLIANRITFGLWEQFELIELGDDNIAIRASVNGMNVCAEDTGLIANRTLIELCEKYKRVKNADGTVSFLSHKNGKYVCSERNGGQPLMANRSAIGPWEKFLLESIQSPAPTVTPTLIPTPPLNLINLSNKKPSIASSSWSSNHAASLGNDGANNTMWASNGPELSPWWKVDLGNEYIISKVEMLARQDINQSTSRNYFEVLGSNDITFNTFTKLASAGEMGCPAYGTWTSSISNSGTYRYVMVRRTENKGHFTFAEFKVFGSTP